MVDIILCTLLLSCSSGFLCDIEDSKSSYYYAPGLAWCLTTWAFTYKLPSISIDRSWYIQRVAKQKQKHKKKCNHHILDTSTTMPIIGLGKV